MHRHFDPSLQGTQSDISSIKYCGESMKFRERDLGSDEYDSSGKVQQAQVGNLKLELPLDDDDYLMPLPQHTQSASTYLDLKNSTDHLANLNIFQNYSELFQNNIDNPEYLMNNESAPDQTVGLPVVDQFEVPPSPGTTEVPTGAYLPQKSSEEESDHECYNDFDRLRRELQPLQKNKDGSIV